MNNRPLPMTDNVRRLAAASSMMPVAFIGSVDTVRFNAAKATMHLSSHADHARKGREIDEDVELMSALLSCVLGALSMTSERFMYAFEMCLATRNPDGTVSERGGPHIKFVREMAERASGYTQVAAMSVTSALVSQHIRVSSPNFQAVLVDWCVLHRALEVKKPGCYPTDNDIHDFGSTLPTNQSSAGGWVGMSSVAVGDPEPGRFVSTIVGPPLWPDPESPCEAPESRPDDEDECGDGPVTERNPRSDEEDEL